MTWWWRNELKILCQRVVLYLFNILLFVPSTQHKNYWLSYSFLALCLLFECISAKNVVVIKFCHPVKIVKSQIIVKNLKQKMFLAQLINRFRKCRTESQGVCVCTCDLPPHINVWRVWGARVRNFPSPCVCVVKWRSNDDQNLKKLFFFFYFQI